MFSFSYTGRFKKDMELIKKRNYNLSLIKTVFEYLAAKGTVPASYKPHKLSGKYTDCIECHIKPDWLLIWRFNSSTEISLVRTGTHSDLF